MSLDENKADLAHSLSDKLLAEAPVDKIVIAGGGFEEEDAVKCSRPNINIRAGTSKKPRYLPIHTICERLKKTIIPEVEAILPFHAITGCNTVSYFAGHSKKTSWKTFTEHHMLLRNRGNGNLDDLTMTSAKKSSSAKYIILLMLTAVMNHAQHCFLDLCHQKLFPLTSDAARLHIITVHFQAMIWKKAHLTNPTLPFAETMGWSRLNDMLIPKLMSLAPVPESCDKMVNCGCKSGCKTMKCVCQNVGVPCTAACKCRST